MVKNTTLREDKVLKSMKKAFPTYSFGKYIDMARLIQPQDFDYKNIFKDDNVHLKNDIHGELFIQKILDELSIYLK